MAECFKVASPVSMFSIGLLSKIGEIFIYAAISDYFSGDDLKNSKPLEYIKLAKNNGIKVSGMLLKKWKFSEEYYQPILYASNLEQNTHMNETRLLYMATNMLDYFDEGVITHKVQEVLIKSQIALGEDHLLKMRKSAIDHFIKLKDIL
jgi:HD-like signal output (HDOD) protein